MNLAGNAVKFTNHGQVVIQRRSETGGTAQQLLFEFAVADTGIGIARNTRGGSSPPSCRPTPRPPASLADRAWD